MERSKGGHKKIDFSTNYWERNFSYISLKKIVSTGSPEYVLLDFFFLENLLNYPLRKFVCNWRLYKFTKRGAIAKKGSRKAEKEAIARMEAIGKKGEIAKREWWRKI